MWVRLSLPGIGAWPSAWDMVAEADSTFLLALATWEASPEERSPPRVRDAYIAVVEAWRRAVGEYRGASLG